MSATAGHSLVRHLRALGRLSSDDEEALGNIAAGFRMFPMHTDIVREGEATNNLHVIVEGFGCRYKMVEGGKRQIVAFLVPGDICDPHVLWSDVMDHSVLTLIESKVALVPKDALRALFKDHPAIMHALMCSVLADESISREWLANMGRRSPDRRIGHLLCEMLVRLRAVGLADDDRFAFPITQADLGDTIGLSTVHVNRTLQDLKEKRLIASRRGVFEVLDLARLKEFSDFEPTYLQMGRSETEVAK